MYMAIAVEHPKHPSRRDQYHIWYLDIDDRGNVVGIGKKTREELIEALFRSYDATGRSNWRAFKKGDEQSTPIEVYDFISQNIFENTHFGELPTLAEFQKTVNLLRTRFEMQATEGAECMHQELTQHSA
ncbi:MAG: hypothetical protein AABY86_09480 [Bdellovibrionota bacterium]